MVAPGPPAARRRRGAPRRRGGRRRGRPRPGQPRSTRSRRSRSTTSRCRSCSTWRRRSPRAPTWCTPTRAPTSAYTWVFDSAEAGTGGAVDAAVRRRRGRHQAALRPAAADPGVHGAAQRRRRPDRRPVHDLVGDADPAHPAASCSPLVTGTPEHKIRVIAPDVGGGFGGKLQVTPEELIAFVAAQRVGKPVKYTETRSESLLSAHHGRDVIQDIELAAKRDGTVTRAATSSCIANMGAYLGLVTPGVPLLGAFMYNAIYKFPAYRFECTGVFTNTTITDAYRGAGRPEATYAIERIMDELAVELGLDPIEVRRRNWINARGVPVHHRRRADLRLGQLRGRHRQGAGPVRLRRAARASRRRRRASGDPVQLGIGVSTYTEMCGLAPVAGAGRAALRRRRLGVGQRPDAAHRQGRGRHRHVPARPGPRDGVEPDRGRPARRAVRRRRGAARRHPHLAQGPGHVRVAVARRRRRRARQGVPEGASRRPSRSPRTCWSATRPTWSSPTGAFRVRGTPERRQDARRLRARRVRRARPARRRRADAGRRRRLRPGQLLLPARHPPVRGRGGHARPAG